jgi:hypothetical protein
MAGIPGQGFQAGSAAAPSSQVEISVSCRSVSYNVKEIIKKKKN